MKSTIPSFQHLIDSIDHRQGWMGCAAVGSNEFYSWETEFSAWHGSRGLLPGL